MEAGVRDSNRGIQMVAGDETCGVCPHPHPHPHPMLVSAKGKTGRQGSRDLGALFGIVGEASGGGMLHR